MHPRFAEEFDWDEGNERELARHHISPKEAEQVFESAVWAPDKRFASGDYKMIGRTYGGRLLTIIVQWKEAELTLRPITGWEATRGERSRYVREP